MRLQIEGVEQDRRTPERFAFGVPGEDSHVRLGDNRNPAVGWDDLPEGCPVEGEFGGEEVMSAIDGHSLAEARVTGVYALNPDVEV